MTTAIRVEKLNKVFITRKSWFGGRHAGVHAVRDLDLTVERGQTLGIVGESGCGKSTLARMLVGLLPATNGSIEIEGETLDNENPAVFGKRIQYVFQDPMSSLNPRKTVLQLMEVPLKYLHGFSKPDRERRIERVFMAVNLPTEFLDRYPHEFSGGQAQRIVIARALAAQARILVLDEPVSALDVSVQAQVLNLLADLKKAFNLTYLFISHDLAVVEAVCDRVAVIYFGSIVEVGPAEYIFSRPGHPYTELLSNSAPVVGRGLKVPDRSGVELPDPLNPPTGCAFAGRCSRATEVCGHTEPLLTQLENKHLVCCHHPLKY
jgi:peptide/nickel transport system ATP-binding protein